MNTNEIFATRITERRQAAGLTAMEVAERVKISRAYISLLEKGHNQPGILPIAANLALVYNTTVDYLLGNTNNPLGAGEGANGAAELWQFYDVLTDDKRATLCQVAKSLYAGQLWDQAKAGDAGAIETLLTETIATTD